jgi:hypothetical protein
LRQKNLFPRRSKAEFTSAIRYRRGIKRFHCARDNWGEAKLGDAGFVLNIMSLVASVEEENYEFSCVVRVDNSWSIRNKYSTLCKT